MQDSHSAFQCTGSSSKALGRRFTPFALQLYSLLIFYLFTTHFQFGLYQRPVDIHASKHTLKDTNSIQRDLDFLAYYFEMIYRSFKNNTNNSYCDPNVPINTLPHLLVSFSFHIIISDYLKGHHRNHASLSLNTSIFLKNKGTLLHNHRTIILGRYLIFTQYYSLIEGLSSNFTNCPNTVHFGNPPTPSPIRKSIQESTCHLVIMFL